MPIEWKPRDTLPAYGRILVATVRADDGNRQVYEVSRDRIGILKWGDWEVENQFWKIYAWAPLPDAPPLPAN